VEGLDAAQVEAFLAALGVAYPRPA
jgi:hypothetical protein